MGYHIYDFPTVGTVIRRWLTFDTLIKTVNELWLVCPCYDPEHPGCLEFHIIATDAESPPHIKVLYGNPLGYMQGGLCGGRTPSWDGQEDVPWEDLPLYVGYRHILPMFREIFEVPGDTRGV